MPANWKVLAENFAGDEYHVPTTHASFFRVLSDDPQSFRKVVGLVDRPQVALGYGSGVPHGLGALELGDRPHLYERDLFTAERVGPEAVAWVQERQRRIEECLGADPVAVRGFSNGNVFPTLSILSLPNAFQAMALLQWHPRGPLLTEVWQWALVEKEAPRSVKELAVRNLLLGQAAAGMLAPDDTENFERSADNLLAQPAAARPFHYAMGVGHDEDPGLRERLRARGVDPTHLPGLIGPYNWEVNCREFYRYWTELMADDTASGGLERGT
jgi:hypothetical protein